MALGGCAMCSLCDSFACGVFFSLKDIKLLVQVHTTVCGLGVSFMRLTIKVILVFLTSLSWIGLLY